MLVFNRYILKVEWHTLLKPKTFIPKSKLTVFPPDYYQNTLTLYLRLSLLLHTPVHRFIWLLLLSFFDAVINNPGNRFWDHRLPRWRHFADHKVGEERNKEAIKPIERVQMLCTLAYRSLVRGVSNAR